MRKWFKRPYLISAAILVLAIVTPVLASGIMHKKPAASTVAADPASRVTAQPLSTKSNASAVQTSMTDQSRVTVTPLDKTLDQVQAQSGNQQSAASSSPANTASGAFHPTPAQPVPSIQSMAVSTGATAAAVQQKSPQQPGHQLSDLSVAELKQQGLSDGQIKKINEIISLGISEGQLAQLLNEKGYANIASALAHPPNPIRQTDEDKKKEKDYEHLHLKVKHEKHGHKGDD